MSWKFLKIALGYWHVSSESCIFIGLEYTKYWELSLDTDSYFSVQKLRWCLQSDQSQLLRGTSWTPTQATELIEWILNHRIEQHLEICSTYHLKRSLSAFTCVQALTVASAFSAHVWRYGESLPFTGEILWAGCSFPYLPKGHKTNRSCSMFHILPQIRALIHYWMPASTFSHF